ncbi:MAG: sulfotransferase [Pseudomonadales bacterium]
MHRVHIVGCRRSGTTLMMELMWQSYAFSGRHEHEISVFEPTPPGETLYLTKKPSDTLRIHRVFRADPNLYLIAMLRDPRAVVTSRHENKPDAYFAGYLRWREYIDAIERLVDHPRFILIRYEDLLNNPDAAQARISEQFSFLSELRKFSMYPEGAEVPDVAAQSLNGVRPFDTSRIDAWRAHLPRVNGQLRDHPNMPLDLIASGYEENDEWIKVLEGVDYYSQKYKDKGPGLARRMESNFRFWLKTQRYLRALEP